MNILFLSINVPLNSKRHRFTYSFIQKEMKYLWLRGHNVYYLSGLGEDTREDKIYYISRSRLLEKNTIVRRIRNVSFAAKYFSFFKPLILKSIRETLHISGTERACINSIRKFDIDVIHTHFFEPSGEAAALSSRICKIPLVATLRGAELHKMPEFDYGACMNRFYETALRNSIGFVDYFTAPNISLCQKLQKHFSVPREKIEYLPNGVEKINFAKDISKNDGEMTFISICNMIRLKNLDIIFEAIGHLLPKFKFKVLIVGSGPLKQRYEKMVNKLFPNNVFILEEMPKDKLFKLISKCDCLIHPSFSEGMPSVVLESLAIGIPCLVSDIPAHHGLIEEGFNGYSFDPYSVESITLKIRFLLLNNDLLSKMRDNCIETAKRYTLESKIDRYIEIYKRLIYGYGVSMNRGDHLHSII